ncbi:MAG TPA: tetratricopeptide repeat protein, partial [Candidatus Hydrogenedentes bacterium]|nr:tetratricopeptide repeat protein [Candidatus Hydrogenedentota bacterium]
MKQSFSYGMVVLCLCCAAAAQTPEQTRMEFADGLFQRGFFAEAVEEYEKYLHDYPTGSYGPTAWYRLGEAAFASEQYEKAIAAFERVMPPELEFPDRLRAAQRRGEALYLLQRHEEAVHAFEPLTGPDAPPDLCVRALYFLGRARLDNRQYDDALRALAAVAERFPGDALAPYAQYQLAYVHLG